MNKSEERDSAALGLWNAGIEETEEAINMKIKKDKKDAILAPQRREYLVNVTIESLEQLLDKHGVTIKWLKTVDPNVLEEARRQLRENLPLLLESGQKFPPIGSTTEEMKLDSEYKHLFKGIEDSRLGASAKKGGKTKGKGKKGSKRRVVGKTRKHTKQ